MEHQTPSPDQIDQAHAEALLLHHDTFYDKLEQETDPERRSDLGLTIKIAEGLKELGGKALVVGGYARDEALRRLGNDVELKDIDLEIYGVEFDRLQEFLQQFGSPKIAGDVFPVVKLGKNLDISIPRRDSKVGVGHKGFVVQGDPHMSISEAARRRDFTINALALDPLTGELVDEFGGLDDMEAGVLRATDPGLFGDDPLRVLRAMQFAGRFGFEVEPQTAEICRSLNLKELSAERISEEWQKLLLKSPKPSVGMEVGKQLGVIDQLHPELAVLETTPQDPEWHPEGNVWVHTKMVVDAAAEIISRHDLSPEDRLVVMLAALCHDLGKPATTREEDGRIKSKEHSEKGIEPTRKFLAQLRLDEQTVLSNKVTNLVKDHLFPAITPEFTDRSVRRLAKRLQPANIDLLVMVASADHRGRALPWDGFPKGAELLRRAEGLKVDQAAPQKIIWGRHLQALGLKEGQQYGRILQELEEAQLDGKFSDEESGLRYLKDSGLLGGAEYRQ